MDNKVILCFIGMSGVGKDTVLDKFLKRNPQFERMVPITTRPIRDGEINGKEYIFVTPDEFHSRIEQNQLMEHRKYEVKTIDNNEDIWYYGNEYPSKPYSAMIGTLETFQLIRKNTMTSDIQIYPIYLSITDSERLYRLITRETKMDKPNFREMIRRFYQDQVDFSPEKLESSGIISVNYDNKFIQLESDSTVTAIEEYVKNRVFKGGDKNEQL